MQEKPFSFLNGCVNILFVDDEPYIHEVLRMTIENNFLFKMESAFSVDKAAEKINNNKYHICLLDILGVNSKKYDAFELIKEYKKALPIIVLSNSDSLEYGAKCIRCGAFKVLSKRSFVLDNNILVKSIKHAYFKKIFYPLMLEGTSGFNMLFNDIYSALVEKKPENVDEWVDAAHTYHKNLSRMFDSWCPLNLKDILKIFHLIDDAFHCSECLFPTCINNPGCKCSVLCRYKNRHKPFYYLQRNKIESYLNLTLSPS